ncbi:zinc knuckle CX2CX4HX4C containing protein [Tanacetum coccineum]
MNPESGDTMKHRSMLGKSSQVNFKDRVTRSGSKMGGLVVDMEEVTYEGEVGESDGVSDVSSRMIDLHKDGGMSDMNESELIFGSISKESVVSNNSNVGVKSKVVNDFPFASNVSINENALGSSGSGVVPEMLVPFDENPILNPNVNVNKKSNGNSVNIKEVKVPGMFRIVGDGSLLSKGVGSVSNFEAGGQSKEVCSGLSNNGGLKQSVSFASAVAKSFGGFGNNKLKFVSTALNEEGREVAVMDPVLEEGIQKWSMTVVGHFVGFQMGYREILGHLKRMWRLYQLEEVIVNQGLYYFNFKSQEGMNSVIENGPWMVENKPLFVRKWEPGLCMSKLDTSKVPLWVKIYDIPLEAWNVDGISRIASRIGVLIIMDNITTSICEKPFGWALYAKVLVEVDAAKGLIDTVEI